MMSMKAALLALELLDRHPECANRLLHGQHRATAAGAAASPVRVAVIWLRPRQVKLLALWRRPAEICASTAGLCSAPSGDGDARAMGRETAVSSSPPRISFQEENELYSSRLLFPFTQPPRVSNALSTPCSRPGTARNSLCLRVQLGLSVCLWLCSRETPAALLHGTWWLRPCLGAASGLPVQRGGTGHADRGGDPGPKSCSSWDLSSLCMYDAALQLCWWSRCFAQQCEAVRLAWG